MQDNFKPKIIDSHAHLDYSELSDDIEGVLARAAEAGVSFGPKEVAPTLSRPFRGLRQCVAQF